MNNMHKKLFLNVLNTYKCLELYSLILISSADGDYTVTIMTKATISYKGTVTWNPPAIYKSYCDMNVEYFPFDEQKCSLKFGSWTYHGDQVNMDY